MSRHAGEQQHSYRQHHPAISTVLAMTGLPMIEHAQASNRHTAYSNLSQPASKKVSYLPGLDGVRALAVVVVCLYHFVIPHSQGGFLGVDLFFLVSGYLITSQLWQKWRDAPIRLWPFWQGRIRRLFPAVIVLLLVVAVVQMLVEMERIRTYAFDVLAAATYTSNWWYIVSNRSYAAEFGLGRPPVLQHLWSLAVEEQFYLLWPLLVAAGIVLLRRRKNSSVVLAAISLGLAVVSALWLGIGSWLADAPSQRDGIDPARWYYGTDTHACGLLLGAALAFWRDGAGFATSGGGVRARPLPQAKPFMIGIGVVSLIGFLICCAVADYNSVWLYRWGFALVAALGLAIVIAASLPGIFANYLAVAPLRYLGTRSYSIYLWHWPVACFTRAQDLHLSAAWGWWVSFLVRTVLTLALAEASYRFVETPLRRSGWNATYRMLERRHLAGVTATAMAVVVVCLTTLAAIFPDRSVEAALHQDISKQTFNPNIAASPRITPSPSPSQASGVIDQNGDMPLPKPPAPPQPPPRRTGDMTVAYFGDSFAVGANPGIQKVFKHVDLFAKVSEQSGTVFTEMLEKKAGSDVVLVHTGNNGTIVEQRLRDVLASYAATSRIIVVQPRVPRSWQDGNRDVITKVCGTAEKPALANVRVADWYTASGGHDSWFSPDGVHPTAEGIAAYTQLIQQAAVAN